VVDDVDFSNLDNVKKINNFEKVQLGSADQAVSIKFSPNGIFDIVDSRNTRDASNSAASESVNTVLKVIGDSKDQVYKATFDRYETINGRLIKSTHTVFVEIQDSVQVDLL